MRWRRDVLRRAAPRALSAVGSGGPPRRADHSPVLAACVLTGQPITCLRCHGQRSAAEDD